MGLAFLAQFEMESRQERSGLFFYAESPADSLTGNSSKFDGFHCLRNQAKTYGINCFAGISLPGVHPFNKAFLKGADCVLVNFAAELASVR